MRDKRYFIFLIEKCYFTIGNMVFKQDIGIPMGIDPLSVDKSVFFFFSLSMFKLVISKKQLISKIPCHKY